MEIRDGKAEARRGLEASGRGVHADGRRGKGVVGREDERSPVLAVVVGCLLRAGEDIVPSAVVSIRSGRTMSGRTLECCIRTGGR